MFLFPISDSKVHTCGVCINVFFCQNLLSAYCSLTGRRRQPGEEDDRGKERVRGKADQHFLDRVRGGDGRRGAGEEVQAG
ncbi:hypothetical protein RHGRI_005067 [Rhododendron griersonianum]|uniref:Uncharacterized protein n=1 Tax=Rhododendron griersonianum TaxID=479676 RepID=A0AAV6LBX1_9ERIC|nr:hypothetical protein RHGRI_005067 [Rhododendron griersonianum]